MVDGQRLAYFVTVAETSSIRRAAELLHMSPAALSRAMKTLEAEVGAPLLAPRGRGIVLTDAGRDLATRARPILRAIADLHDVGERREDVRPVLRYGSHETFGTYFASELVAAAGRDIEIEHRYLPPDQLERALLGGVVDAGVTYLAQPRAGTQVLPAGSVAMGVFGRPAFLEVPFDDYEFALPAGPVVDSPLQAQALDGWPAPSIHRRSRYRVTHTETALEHARMGRCVAYFATFVVALHNRRAAANRRLVELPVPDEVAGHRQDVYVVVREGEADGDAARWLLDAVHRVTDIEV